MIILGNAQIGQMTDIHDNQVANVTIGTNEAKQRPTVPMEEPEEVSCEIVPEAQEQQTEEEEDPASQPSLKLTSYELHVMHKLKLAGLLNKDYQFYTKKEMEQNPKALVLNQCEKLMVAQALGKLLNHLVPEANNHLQRYCVDYWHITTKEKKDQLSNDCSRYKRENKERAKAFQKKLDEILSKN